MTPRLRTALAALVGAVALVAGGSAHAAGGNYAFDGGTAKEQAQVTAALDASSFDWSVVPVQIIVHITKSGDSDAAPGQIFLTASLLDSGRFSWGVVQHEYAHQVDFFLLDDAKRAVLAPLLGGKAWWQRFGGVALPHGQLSSERFASTLAWSYWQSPDNSMKPQSSTDESAAMAPAAFKAALAQVLAQPRFAAATQTQTAAR